MAARQTGWADCCCEWSLDSTLCVCVFVLVVAIRAAAGGVLLKPVCCGGYVSMSELWSVTRFRFACVTCICLRATVSGR